MTFDSRPILVCTLGGKAQVATFTIDALLQQQIEISKVVVFHHAPPHDEDRLRKALRLVNDEVYSYYQSPFTFQAVPIRAGDTPITDLDDSDALSAIWETLDGTIGDLKKRHREIHFCFTAGGRLLAMQAMAVLSLHATPTDALWHLYTPPSLREQAGTNEILHATMRPDLPAPHLVRVPMVPWAYFFKGLRALLQLNPQDAIRLSGTILDEQEEQRCVRVWGRLPRSKRRVFRCIIEGQSLQQAAQSCTITLATVKEYMGEVQSECRTEWGLGADVRPSPEWYQQRFAPCLPKLREMFGD